MTKAKTGFNAMGLSVPANRLQTGYETVKEMLGCNNETAMLIARRVARFIEKDMISYIIGDVCLADTLKRQLFDSSPVAVDEEIASIDLIGRYRLLAVMLTD